MFVIYMLITPTQRAKKGNIELKTPKKTSSTHQERIFLTNLGAKRMVDAYRIAHYPAAFAR